MQLTYWLLLGIGLHAGEAPSNYSCANLDFALICRHGILVIWESGVERGVLARGALGSPLDCIGWKAHLDSTRVWTCSSCV
jgi:hypothetical protein